MAFTLSHISAVLPLGEKIKPGFCRSALYLGAMMPDLSYFLPFPSVKLINHSLSSAFLVQLPLGVFIVVLFEYFLRESSIALLPWSIGKRLPPRCPESLSLSKLLFTGFFLLLGIFSHLLWDSFTHSTGLFVDLIPALRYMVFRGTSVTLPLFRLLQYLSSLVGLLIMVLLGGRWYLSSSLKETLAFRPPVHLRIIQVVVVVLPLVFGILFSLQSVSTAMNPMVLKYTGYRAIRIGGMVLLLEIAVWGLLWNLCLRYSPTG